MKEVLRCVAFKSKQIFTNIFFIILVTKIRQNESTSASLCSLKVNKVSRVFNDFLVTKIRQNERSPAALHCVL